MKADSPWEVVVVVVEDWIMEEEEEEEALGERKQCPHDN